MITVYVNVWREVGVAFRYTRNGEKFTSQIGTFFARNLILIHFSLVFGRTFLSDLFNYSQILRYIHIC